jgi:Ferritin-like domain
LHATAKADVKFGKEEIMEEIEQSEQLTSRRSFLVKGAAAGAGALAGGRLLASASPAFASGGLTRGDAAILRFLAALEILEADIWQQYNELAGIQDSEVPGGSGNPAYTEAVAVLDEDMDQYIHDNTDDEFSHVAFINAYLKAHGARTVNLDKFQTLPSSKATGAQQIGRLTNLMQLTVNTSFWTRYRSDSQNPDLGDTLPQAVPGLAAGQFPAIPRSDDDLSPPDHLQAIANTAGFHFAWIEQGVPAFTPHSPSGSPIARCCASCSASAAPKRCTSRPGTTRPATRLRSPTPRTAWSSPTSTPTVRSCRPT